VREVLKGIVLFHAALIHRLLPGVSAQLLWALLWITEKAKRELALKRPSEKNSSVLFDIFQAFPANVRFYDFAATWSFCR
jgi:hypothetical protein